MAKKRKRLGDKGKPSSKKRVENFNQALRLAKHHGIRVAYSNQAFELWYLLHFHYYNTALRRQDYMSKLTECLYFKYEKNLDIYDVLEPYQPEAIRNATKLLNSYGDRHDPARDDPSTTVHELVQELNEVAR